MTAFVVHYALILLVILAYSLHYRLVPTILMFLTTIALGNVMRLGFQARTKSGVRVALAGMFTLCAYVCLFIYEYHYW